VFSRLCFSHGHTVKEECGMIIAYYYGIVIPKTYPVLPREIMYQYKKESLMNITHEKIEARAYDLYLQRNGNGGSPLEDWLKAEKEIEKGKTVRIGKKHPLTNK
jgi:hypothetical protein